MIANLRLFRIADLILIPELIEASINLSEANCLTLAILRAAGARTRDEIKAKIASPESSPTSRILSESTAPLILSGQGAALQNLGVFKTCSTDTTDLAINAPSLT